MYTIKKSKHILKNKYNTVKGYSKYNKTQLNNLIVKCSNEAYDKRKNINQKYYTILDLLQILIADKYLVNNIMSYLIEPQNVQQNYALVQLDLLQTVVASYTIVPISYLTVYDTTEDMLHCEEGCFSADENEKNIQEILYAMFCENRLHMKDNYPRIEENENKFIHRMGRLEFITDTIINHVNNVESAVVIDKMVPINIFR